MCFASFSSCDSGLENYRPQPSELPSKFSNSQPRMYSVLSIVRFEANRLPQLLMTHFRRLRSLPMW
jgi:hypothetical protein